MPIIPALSSLFNKKPAPQPAPQPFVPMSLVNKPAPMSRPLTPAPMKSIFNNMAGSTAAMASIAPPPQLPMSQARALTPTPPPGNGMTMVPRSSSPAPAYGAATAQAATVAPPPQAQAPVNPAQFTYSGGVNGLGQTLPGYNTAGTGGTVTPNAIQTVTPPPAPVVNPALSGLEAQYRSLLGLSPEEEAAQQRINDLDTSTSLGLLGEENRIAAMPLITGRQEALLKQSNIQANTLQNQLALAQAKRQAALEGTRFSISRIDEENKLQRQLDAEERKAQRENNQPFTVSEGASVLQRQADGSYKSVFTGPTSTANRQTEITDVNGRKVLIDKQTGQVITDLGEKKDTEMLTEYQAERAQRVVSQVDDIISKVSGMNTGFASLAGVIPGTPQKDFAAQLETLKANIGFNELQAMRAASPTGGALGQVAVQELNFLQSVLGSLDARQSPAQLKQNLEQIKTHFNNWLAVTNQAKQSTATSGGGTWSW